MRSALLAIVTTLLAGCGVGGAEGRKFDVGVTGRVALGVLAGARVDVYGLDDLSTPRATTTTSTSIALPDAGRFEVPLDGIRADDLFLFVVSGGQALDADADGLPDAAPTPNLGSVHAIASGAHLLDGPLSISVMSEIVYRRARHYVAARYDEAFLLPALDAWAGRLLRAGLDGDDDVDLADVLAFAAGPARLFHPATAFRELEALVLVGEDPTALAMALSEAEVGFQDLPGETRAIQVVGERAYVARGDIGLEIYDVSVPTAPALLGTYDSPGSALDVAVVGTVAYLADRQGGLQIVDATNPLLPAQAGVVPLDQAEHVLLDGNRAYVAVRGTAPILAVVDVTQPATAAVIGGAPALATPHDLARSGVHVYAAVNGGVEVFDVSDPTNPQSLGITETEDDFVRVDADAGVLYAGGRSGLEHLDLADPAQPVSLGVVELPDGGNAPADVKAIGGDRLAVALSFRGLALLDVAGPTPRLLGTHQVSGGAGPIGVTDGLLVLNEVNGGLQVLTAANPPPSAVIGRMDAIVLGLAAEAGRVVVGVNDRGRPRVALVDVDDPTRPRLGAGVDVDVGAIQDVALSDDLAFVSGSGLQVVDVGNAAAPTVLGGDLQLGAVGKMTLAGDLLYGAATPGLRVIDVSTPATPVSLVDLPTSGQSHQVAVDGRALLLADGFPGLATFDAIDPAAPVPAGGRDVGQPVAVEAAGGLAFVTNFSGTGIQGALVVLDHANLAAPTEIRRVRLRSTPARSLLSGDRYYAASTGVIEVLDVSAPRDPRHVASLQVPARGFIGHVAQDGPLLYAGTTLDGLLVFRAPQRDVP